MGVILFIIVIVLVLLILYFVLYPAPLVWAVRKYINRGWTNYYDDLESNATVLQTFDFDGFKGNLYLFKLDGVEKQLSDYENVVLWFHGGAFVQGDVLGKPILFDKLLSKNIGVMAFDYPIVFNKFSQEQIQQYLTVVTEWVLKNIGTSKITFLGDSMGSLYLVSMLNEFFNRKDQITDSLIWPELNATLTSANIISISGFGPEITKKTYKMLFDFYITKRGTDISGPITLNPKIKALLLSPRDALHEDSIEFNKKNPDNTILITYDCDIHDFMLVKPTSNSAIIAVDTMINFIKTGTIDPAPEPPNDDDDTDNNSDNNTDDNEDNNTDDNEDENADTDNEDEDNNADTDNENDNTDDNTKTLQNTNYNTQNADNEDCNLTIHTNQDGQVEMMEIDC